MSPLAPSVVATTLRCHVEEVLQALGTLPPFGVLLVEVQSTPPVVRTYGVHSADLGPPQLQAVPHLPPDPTCSFLEVRGLAGPDVSPAALLALIDAWEEGTAR